MPDWTGKGVMELITGKEAHTAVISNPSDEQQVLKNKAYLKEYPTPIIGGSPSDTDADAVRQLENMIKTHQGRHRSVHLQFDGLLASCADTVVWARSPEAFG